MKRREQTKPNGLEEDQSKVQQSEVDVGNHDVLQPNVKFASLRSRLVSIMTLLMMTQ
jgi:hypothetical protein